MSKADPLARPSGTCFSANSLAETRKHFSPRVALMCVVVQVCIFASVARAQTVTEYPLSPSGFVGSPGGITAGPDGAVWFTVTIAPSDGGYIGRATPAGAIEFQIPTSGAGPVGIVTGPDGNLWFTEGSGNKIGRITPAGSIVEYDLSPGFNSPQGIAVGPDGNLWFTEGATGKIGRITPSGFLTDFQLPPMSVPLGIVAGPDGALWFADLVGRIGRLTTRGDLTEFQLPTDPGCGADEPSGIAVGPDGALWATERSLACGFDVRLGGKIERLTSAGELTRFDLPAGHPFEICSAPDGNLWFTYLAGQKIGKITPDGIVTDIPTPSPLSWTHGITAGPDGAIWFTEENRAVARITNINCAQPAKPVISAPINVIPGETGIVASVPPSPGSTYSWEVVNGTITSGVGTPSVMITAGSFGGLYSHLAEMRILASEISRTGCYSPRALAVVALVANLSPVVPPNRTPRRTRIVNPR